MANEEHLAILKRGVEVWNQWRKDHPDIRPDLTKADLHLAMLYLAELTQADLSGAILSKANLSFAVLGGADLSRAELRSACLQGTDFTSADLVSADLRWSDLQRAKLGWADLSGANLRRTDLREADLHGTDLRWANLTEANLIKANVRETNLSGANLAGARAGWNLFAALDLSTAQGLEAVVHDGPSTIGIDTLHLSRGQIPEAFLRGAGVPDGTIKFMRSLAVQNGLQSCPCFIRYATKDQEFAERLYADLQSENVRCWFAPEDIQGGQVPHDQMDEAIRHHDKLVVVLSQVSMKSRWLKREIRYARFHEGRAGGRMLFPISLVPFDLMRDWEAFDADIGKDIAVEVREYFIPDFSFWKDHDAYNKAFDRLLRDLKAEAE